MKCAACARPVAMARETCIYCGAALSRSAVDQAAEAARRVIESKNPTHLEAAASGRSRDTSNRRYVVIDTNASPASTIALACSVSLWEARQWQIAARYRLVKVSSEPSDGPMETRLREEGLHVFAVPEAAVAPARHPLHVESMDTSMPSVECTLRDDPESAAWRRDLPLEHLALIVSGPIRREKVKELGSLKKIPDRSLDDVLIVHLHFRDESRPWELDPRRTAFESEGPASAHMRTLELVRRLSQTAPLDEAFRNVVPALGHGTDSPGDLAGLRSTAKTRSKDPDRIVLDNLAQFREYSAWRGGLALLHPNTR